MRRSGLVLFSILVVSGCRFRNAVSTVRDVDVPARETPADEQMPPIPAFVCDCSVNAVDSDGDCEPDQIEDTNRNGSYEAGTDFTDVHNPDTDGDGIKDGCEDIDHDGVVKTYPPELDPRNPDSDGDGISDGLEDVNGNGRIDFGETNGASSDSDADGIPDGIEDKNKNGVVDCGPAAAPTMPPCETNPRDIDSDHDGLTDFVELKTRYYPSDPPYDFIGFDGRNPSDPFDDQTIPWNADSDGDGLNDGLEDANGDGLLSTGESDPRQADSDTDGLNDGLEDANHDGFWDSLTETNPALIDSDGDGLSDGIEDSGGCLTVMGVCAGTPSNGDYPCNCAHWHNGKAEPNESDPRLFDTDADGIRDGGEDRNGDGVCQRPAPRAIPRASDESCAFLRDSDGDNIQDGVEDVNANGQIDKDETDPRRADSDNDCLNDAYELLVGTNPFVNDTDGDGLPDGLESAERLIFNGTDCVTLVCNGAPRYATTTCPNPLVRDTDGDGAADGAEALNGLRTGEDENQNGCVDPGESNPCEIDALRPPAFGDDTCMLGTCDGSVDLRSCTTGECGAARKAAQALVCSEGNVRPVTFLRSEENDYALALPATFKDGVLLPLFADEPLKVSGVAVGQAFQSQDAAAAEATEPIKGIYGAIVRLGTLSMGSACSTVLDTPALIDHILPAPPAGGCPIADRYVVWSAALTPTDVSDRAAKRIIAQLNAAGYLVERTSGGVQPAHDDESRRKANGTSVLTATDIYGVRKIDGQIDAAEIEATATRALIGGTQLNRSLPAVAEKSGPKAELRIQFYRRVVNRRDFGADGSSQLVRIAQYGAVLAVAPHLADCSTATGAARLACKKQLEPGLIPLSDLTNGSALSRYQASTNHSCDSFDPAKSKADFLIGIDDSGSMQEFILAIQRAVRDVAFKLQANAGNMDWRIAMTTSSMGQGDDAGPRPDLTPLAIDDPFIPGSDASGAPGSYPKLQPSGIGGPQVFFAYQTTAFDNNGVPQRCTYSDTFDPNDPTKSPYCCDLASATDADFVMQCCSLQQGQPPTAFYGSSFTLADQDTSTFGSSFNPRANDTLRCFDIPRFGENINQAWSYIPYYPTGLAGATGVQITQDNNLTARHLNDYLCGNWELTRGGNGVYSLSNFQPPKLWGARGHLWPAGFVGQNANPRLDGANLLVRNADMLVVQMNRQCYKHATDASIVLPSPRAFQQAGAEQLLQAMKRAVQRASSDGRATNTPNLLRTDAPLISLLVSDEEDFSFKIHDEAAKRPFRDFLAERDRNQLPEPTCTGNGDAGCTLAYCQDTCFADLVDQGDPAFAIPSAKSYRAASKRIVKDSSAGAYCIAPPASSGPVDANCTTGFCASGPSGSDRYDGFHYIAAGEYPDDDGSVANQQSGANSRSRDVLNPSLSSPGQCNPVCGSDCQPCNRFLREKQYVDFFGGKCSPPDGNVSDLADIRRYPRPTVNTVNGDRVLPLGLTYAIARRPDVVGGSEGACGSNYAGGDGQGLRRVALATGGKSADICLATTQAGYAEFLDQIVVDAQGLGSPYRLSGNPISSTLRVGVLGKDGNFRMIRRSTVAGFDYNVTSRSIAFFAESQSDLYNAISEDRDAKVFVSYVVWMRNCGDDCPLGDVCTICTCSATTPHCCTPTPTFVCQSPTPCPQGCNPCEQCDAESNECVPVNACSNGCGSGACTINGCETCANGTRVEVPCADTSGECPSPTREVCMTREGISNTDGASCLVTGQAQPNQDCCGDEKVCDPGEVCVLKPCAGGGCLPTAECRRPDDGAFPLAQWCGDCPFGTTCSPVPCPGEDCAPAFRCVADNLGASATCDRGPECGCPNNVCADCPVGYFCSDDRQCERLCASTVPTTECCEDPSLRVKPLQCCPPGEYFDVDSQACKPGILCNGPCPDGYFCDPYSGHCIPKGG